LNNAWGFVPGEAAAALLVASVDLADRRGLDRCGRVLAVAGGVEANRIKTQTVCLGQALSEVLQRVLMARPKNALVSDVYNDMNGEPYRADEFGFAIARTGEAFERPSDMVTSADCTGDVGAAGGALHIALAAIAARKGYAAGNLAIVHAGSESGERGAALIGFA
jgi:3-oxoacyl-[acyl-carrier-protein] synthase-1